MRNRTKLAALLIALFALAATRYSIGGESDSNEDESSIDWTAA